MQSWGASANMGSCSGLSTAVVRSKRAPPSVLRCCNPSTCDLVVEKNVCTYLLGNSVLT